MEWTVVTALVVLIGLFFTVGKPIMSYAKEMHNLRFETDRQEKEIDRNIDTIKELVKLSQSHENRLTDHEKEMSEIRAQTTELLRISQLHEGRIIHLEHDMDDIKSKEKEEK